MTGRTTPTRSNVNNLPTLGEVLTSLTGEDIAIESEMTSSAEQSNAGETPVMPSWVVPGESAMMPPNLIEQLVIAHRERDAALALYQQHENRRGGLFDGFLFAMGLPLTTTYDLATGMATVPKAE